MASWLALVEEAVLTQQQRQTANTTKITQFFIRCVPMTDIRVEANILRAPFSAEYYRRRMPNQRHKAQASQPTNPKPPRPKQWVNSRKEQVQQPSTTLLHHGFFRRESNNNTVVSGLGKHQWDTEAAKTDYSGTLVSTVP